MDNYSARALVQKAVGRKMAEIQVDLDHAEAEQKRWGTRVRELRQELGVAAATQTPPHPLHGRDVRRRVKGYRWSEWRNQFGVMCQNTSPAALHVGRGNYSIWVSPGGYYVRTRSGNGAYGVDVHAQAEPWELDE